MLRKLFFLLAVLLLPIGFAAAQESGGFTIFSFDIGVNPAYNLEPPSGKDAFAIATSFGLNLRMTDSLIVGFTTFGSDLTLLNLKYDILKSVRAGISIGMAGANVPDILANATANKPVGGLGFEYIPFARKISGLSTEFKIGASYLFPTSKIDKGSFLFGLTLGVGV